MVFLIADADKGRKSQWLQRRTTPLVRFALDAKSPPCHTSNVRLTERVICLAVSSRGGTAAKGNRRGPHEKTAPAWVE